MGWFRGVLKDRKKFLKAAVWILSPFLFGSLRVALGAVLGIPTGSIEDELVRLLLSPATERLFMPAMFYHIFFLMITAMAVTIALQRVVSYWGWRYALGLIGPLCISLRLFWHFNEVGIVFVFSSLGLLNHALRHKREIDKKKQEKGVRNPFMSGL